MPGMLRKSTAFVPRYQKFESTFLQRRVSCEPDFPEVNLTRNGMATAYLSINRRDNPQDVGLWIWAASPTRKAEPPHQQRLPAFSLFLPGSCPNTRDRRNQSTRMIMALAAPGAAGRQGRASAPRVWPPSFFPLPSCVIDAAPGRLACEHIMGIYVSHECLAGRGLHSHVALRSYVSLIREVERGETRYAVLDRQSRCHGEIWASRSRGAHVFGETANVRSIEVSRRLAGDAAAAAGGGGGCCGAQAAMARTGTESKKKRLICSSLWVRRPG